MRKLSRKPRNKQTQKTTFFDSMSESKEKQTPLTPIFHALLESPPWQPQQRAVHRGLLSKLTQRMLVLLYSWKFSLLLSRQDPNLISMEQTYQFLHMTVPKHYRRLGFHMVHKYLLCTYYMANTFLLQLESSLW